MEIKGRDSFLEANTFLSIQETDKDIGDKKKPSEIIFIPYYLQNEFYKRKDWAVATNKQYSNKMIEIFSKVDYSSESSLKDAISEYKKLMSDVYRSVGIKNMPRNNALTELLNYDADNLMARGNGSYKKIILSRQQVKQLFGNSKNYIDVYK